jgi:hypothetical protein
VYREEISRHRTPPPLGSAWETPGGLKR